MRESDKSEERWSIATNGCELAKCGFGVVPEEPVGDGDNTKSELVNRGTPHRPPREGGVRRLD